MQDIILIAAGAADIPLIADLARLIWRQHYTDIIGENQIAYMLQKMYSSESLLEQISEKQNRFFIIQDGQITLGFISIIQENNTDWFLSKFYINQNFARKGIGSSVFKNILEGLDPTRIKLTVNRQNFKAINFYFKLGFRIQSVADFDIGQGYFMNDFVMVWQKT
ncbi:MAG TPA: GNAT family N-acetyltransferase [Bacteroidia bacterium]|nr:GNAT family N-acetyltransferase [Bacteroidia bacterium]